MRCLSREHNARRFKLIDANLPGSRSTGRYFKNCLNRSIVSIEESGKVFFATSHFASSPDEEVRRRVWKDYRSHRSKNGAWILPQLVAEGARDLGSLRLVVDPSSEHTALLNQIKQIGFYTDCLGDAHWSEPEKVIDESLARSLVRIADLLAKGEIVTVKEMELWVEHIRPVYWEPIEEQKTALLNWYAAMRENGLWEDDGVIPVETFVRGEQES